MQAQNELAGNHERGKGGYIRNREKEKGGERERKRGIQVETEKGNEV